MDDKLEFNAIFTDGKGNFGFKVFLSEHLFFDEKSGYLYCNDVVLGNVGVQYYKGYELGFSDRNATIEVHREESDVFDEISLESLKGKPVTLRHPKKLLDSDTTTDHIRGAIYGEPRRDGDNIVCDLVIYDRELIDLVAPEGEDGERALSKEFRDLSLGYKAKLVPLDKPNTYKQTNILYNHVAVLEAGRQVNAMIRDEANKEIENELNQKKEGKALMGLFGRIKGKAVKRNEETNEVVITDEEVEVEVDIEDAKVLSESMYHSIDKRQSYDDPNKVITTERVTTEVTTEEEKDEKTKIYDEENQELDKDKKEIKNVDVKDKAYFVKALREAQSLPDGEIKVATIADLNKEFADAFPSPQVEIKDGETKKAVIKPVNNEEFEKEITDGETPKIDFIALENEAKQYYRKLTDPFAHASWKEFNDHYSSEVRKGRSEIA